MTLNETWSRGIWIIGGSSVISEYIHSCVVCSKVRAAVESKKMSDFPSDRVEPSPPFTFCTVDYFGPFVTKENHREVKHYGVLCNFLCSRAVHLEVANSLSTSSLINLLRRFIALRGPISVLRSDQGTNFVDARKEHSETGNRQGKGSRISFTKRFPAGNRILVSRVTGGDTYHYASWKRAFDTLMSTRAIPDEERLSLRWRCQILRRGLFLIGFIKRTHGCL